MEVGIRIQGHLDPSWQAWLGGLQIEQEATGTTLLSGNLPDQAALFGVLLKIQRLGMPLLGINSAFLPPILKELCVTTPILGSILLGSRNPQRLQTWYRIAFGLPVTVDGFLQLGAVNLLIDTRDDITDTNPEPGRFIINLHVADARSLAAHLTGLGITWLASLEERTDGLFGTLIDPDGNYVQIIQLTEAYYERQTAG